MAAKKGLFEMRSGFIFLSGSTLEVERWRWRGDWKSGLMRECRILPKEKSAKKTTS